MKHFVRIIDENGLFIEDAFVDELTANTIETPCPDGFILPRWDGLQWVEGGTAPEPLPPPEPTLDERNRADIDYIALMTGVVL